MSSTYSFTNDAVLKIESKGNWISLKKKKTGHVDIYHPGVGMKPRLDSSQTRPKRASNVNLPSFLSFICQTWSGRGHAYVTPQEVSQAHPQAPRLTFGSRPNVAWAWTS
ncbi:hypothetical protein PIB30_055798 [Stylosanthes scabra]|uniref:Uncharacterized protein n=1 Tax=Stylosanthes scabra TaxID=79078 RepID=A0ABU6RK32_9FABA|nr:hypothetical protein [Stylosanthes scabra]